MAGQLNTSDSILLKKITELDPVSTAEATALLLLYQEGATKKIPVAALLQGLAKSVDIAAAYCTLVGIQAISGEKTFTSTLNLLNASMGLAIDTVAGAESKIALKTAGLNRWVFVSSDANKTFELRRYSEAGALVDSPIKVSTLTGKVETSSLKATALAVDSASGTAGRLAFTTLDQNRWQLLKSATAESGSNVGSDLTVNRYADDGTYIDTPITVSRSAGSTTFNKDLVANQKIISNGEIQAKFVNANRTGTLATQHTILANQASTTGFNISAIAAVSENVDFTCLQVTGKEKDTGTIKVAHIKPDSIADNNAAALSIDLQGVGTAAKGIYINSTPAGGTTGDLVDIRNNSIQQMRVTAGGSLSVATDFSAPEGKVSIKLSNDTDVALAIKANSDTGANLINLKKSSGSTVLSVSSTGVLTAVGRIEGTDTNKAIAINTATATDGRLSFDEAGASRWQIIRKATSADLTVQRYNSSGTFQDTPITIASATGALTVTKDVTLSGSQAIVNGELKAFGTVHVRNTAAPSVNPTNGVILYTEGNDLKYRDASGAIFSLSAVQSLPHPIGSVVDLPYPVSASALFSSTDGWLWYPATGNSIGKATSNAVFNNDKMLKLYSALWANVDVTAGWSLRNAANTVITKGATALADWTANLKLDIPNFAGRVAVGAGSGPGLQTRVVGTTGGGEVSVITLANLPEIPFRRNDGTSQPGNPFSITADNNKNAYTANQLGAINVGGTSAPMDRMQPWFATNQILFTGERA